MNLLFHVSHPGHVHLFKNLIKYFSNENNLMVTAISKEMTTDLLDNYNIEYKQIGFHSKTLYGKIFNLITTTIKLCIISSFFRPDLVLSVAGINASFAAKFSGSKSYVLDDTDHFTLGRALYGPLAYKVVSPESSDIDLKDKSVRYSGYHSLFHLHPSYFVPNHEVLREIGVVKGQKYAILRLVAWNAYHDRGLHVQRKYLDKIINFLRKDYKIFITGEASLPSHLKKYQLKIKFHDIHSVIYFSDLVVSEGGTMATEASILGIPSIHVNSLARKAGVNRDLEEVYGLKIICNDFNEAYEEIKHILQIPNIKLVWQQRRKNMLNHNDDPNKLIIDMVSNNG